MKRWNFSWAMFVGAALSLGQVAFAEDEKPQAGPNPEQLFKNLDKNADGQLSGDEVQEEQKRFFERLVRVGDKNEDGKLSSDEFQNATKSDDRPVDAPRGDAGGQNGRPNPEEMFKRLDANGDGKLTKSEIPEGARPFLNPLFERLGKDELTKEDVIRAAQRMGGGGAGAPGGRNPEEFFKQLDTNNDGKVGLDEVPERGKPLVERLLQALGRGKDATVTKEEFLTAAARMQGDGRRPGVQQPGGERKPDGNGRPEAERKPDGDRRPEGERKPDGDRRPEGGDRRPEGDRRPGGAPGEGRAMEGGRRPPLPRFFEKLDANHDGRISSEELAKAVETLKDLDENGDGQLDPRELLGPPPAGGDAGQRGQFGRQMEGDRPGQGRRPEGDRPREGGRPAGEGDRPREGGRPGEAGRPGEGSRLGGGNFVEQLFKQFDKNGDSKLSLEEAPDRMRERFNQIDKNGDGQIEKSEFPMGGSGGFPGGDGRGRRPDGGAGGRPEQEKPAEDKPGEKKE